jgi:hypothetical protein
MIRATLLLHLSCCSISEMMRWFVPTLGVSLVLTAGQVACSTTVVEAPAPADAAPAPSPTGSAARPPGLDTSCWKPDGHPCNPASGAGCADGTVCEYSSTETDIVIACVPAAGSGALGAKCSEGQRGACGAGLRCLAGACAKVCCSRSDCASGEACEAFETPLGSLGACAAPKACAKAGGHCAKATDCCSKDCHDDHCH